MALTPAERAKRAREKKKLLALASGKGGVDRLSELVVQQVRDGVAAGILVPTVKDGLAAERLIDQRAAKTDDRKTAIAIAALLAGGAGAFLAPPELTAGDDGADPFVIEGEAVEVDV